MSAPNPSKWRRWSGTLIKTSLFIINKKKKDFFPFSKNLIFRSFFRVYIRMYPSKRFLKGIITFHTYLLPKGSV